jgi:hypothetical protein
MTPDTSRTIVMWLGLTQLPTRGRTTARAAWWLQVLFTAHPL